MKAPFIAFALLASAVSPAVAADEVTFAPEASAFSWSGFYAGVSAGGAFGGSDDVPWGLAPGALVNNDGPADMRGFIGGIFAGAQMQYGNFVFGVEGDIDYTDFNGDDEDRGGDTNAFEGEWAASLRARLGYAINRTHVYTTGGFAYMAGDALNREDPAESHSTSFTGWTIGAGVEHAFTDMIIGRLEYRYSDFSLSVEEYYGGAYFLGFEPVRHDIRLGVAVKF